MAVADPFNQVRARQSSIPSARRLYADASRAEEAIRPTLLPPAADRWSLRVEVKDDEIARLYSQGLTRGALVWRAGMPEWRPLLLTPELSRLLHSTPITLRDVSDPSLEDEVTLPRPARLPSGMSADDKRDVPTVAPSVTTVVPPAKRSLLRRRAELAVVASCGFCLAWFARGGVEPEAAPAAAVAASIPAPPLPAAAPTPEKRPEMLLVSGGAIPTVALHDLPVLGAGARSSVTPGGRGTSRSRASAPASGGDGGPTRAQLMAALGQVASVASGCGERGGPVRVVIAFAPSGVARSIQVSGKELPSPVRSCIIGAASRARVASFSGDPVTVSKTL